MRFLTKTADRLFHLLFAGVSRRRFGVNRLLGQRLEERMMLAIDIDFLPVGGEISELHEPDTYIVPPGGQFEMEVQIRSDVRELIVGWQLQFGDTSFELCLSSFANQADWIPLGMLDSCNGHTLTSGANFQGIELVPGTTYSLGTFQGQAPDAEGVYRLTVDDLIHGDRTAFTSLGGPIWISDYGDVTILVNHGDLQPVAAHDDFYSTPIDTPITFDPMLNDDREDATLVPLSEPQSGNLAVNADDTLTYTPNPGFVGLDSFDYRIENALSMDMATVTIEVIALNAAPVANDDMVVTHIDAQISIDVLENDVDTEDDELTLVSVSAASGQIVVQDDQSLLYTPPLNFVGEDSFTYVVTDGEFSSTATVAVEIIPNRVGIDIDFRPVDPDRRFEVGGGANGEDILYANVGEEFVVEVYIDSRDTTRVLVGWQLQFALTELLIHSFDNALDWIRLGTLDTGAGETLVSGSNFVGIAVEEEPVLLGSFTVQTPELGAFLLTTRSPVHISPADSSGFASLATSVPVLDFGDTIVMVEANVEASDDTVETLQDTAVTVDVLDNDGAFDGSTLGLFSVEQPMNGTVEINADDTITYTPTPSFTGVDTFSYTAWDGTGTDTATVTIQVTAPPPANESFTQIGDDLVFRGTEGRDRITVRSQADPSRIVITTDANSYGPLTLGPDGVLEIFALGGNDDVRIAGYLDELVTVVDGGNGNDRLFGSGGNDTLIGGTGNDAIFGGQGLNWLDGGGGNDELRGGNDGNVLVGHSGNDRLLGGNGNDVLDGGQGNDELLGLLGDDVLLGREDNDVLLGGTGSDFVFGEGGNDIVKGDSGNDLLFGGEGRDVLNGGRGEDAVVGGQTDLMTELDAHTQLSDLLLSWTVASTWGDRLDAVQFSPEDDAEADTLIGGSDADVFFSTNDDTPTDLTSNDVLN